jgi:hypothetical protein
VVFSAFPPFFFKEFAALRLLRFMITSASDISPQTPASAIPPSCIPIIRPLAAAWGAGGKCEAKCLGFLSRLAPMAFAIIAAAVKAPAPFAQDSGQIRPSPCVSLGGTAAGGPTIPDNVRVTPGEACPLQFVRVGDGSLFYPLLEKTGETEVHNGRLNEGAGTPVQKA